MKTKLQILVFLMLSFCLTVPLESIHSVEEAPVITTTKELPSSSYLKREKRSIVSETETSALAAPARGLLSRAGSKEWTDPFLPGDGEWSNPGNVGAPIGDISLPIILSILFLYMIYRGVSTSRRRNNF
ncbi:hypothetical protein JGH11_04050 [Dysgonomonas sp. Marseille-P4677]|uniref:hypothetical protein n=1 Tax=Dysgonomonas sp. Marseille-P4677 TaxID=2364790 RepID=UPI001911F4B5|nr:hypothetical protein [Dysgonomonas sp. Marseille-P4677]MBK5720037.1 hypothetical protein [Dysgonomonas sp. Marseille-P4677]